MVDKLQAKLNKRWKRRKKLADNCRKKEGQTKGFLKPTDRIKN